MVYTVKQVKELVGVSNLKKEKKVLFYPKCMQREIREDMKKFI